MKSSSFFLLLIFGFLSSCSYFIGKIDTPLVDKNDYLKNIPEVPTYCPLDLSADLQIINANPHSQEVYASILPKMGKRLDILDHLIFWSLVQMAVRPEQSAPSSRLQIIFNLEGKTHYYDFFSDSGEDQYPYLYGLEWILRKFNRKESLEHYARVLQGLISTRFRLGKEFANFLVRNQDFIKKNAELAPYYYRGTDILKESESFPDLDFTKIIALYRQSQKAQKVVVNSSLIKFSTDRGQSGSCNYDFNLYDNSIFLIDKAIPIANIYGIATPRGSFFASSSQKLDKAQSFFGTHLFKGDSKVRSSAVCVIENEDNKIWTFSNQSRDPGQHLFHLVRYGLARAQSTEEVDKLLRHSRHLFLSDPVRLVIESGRSNPEQIENLLKLSLPIYNAQRLGNIWAYTQFQNASRFLIDDRNPGAYLCK
jgi:hypothetical protein